MRRLLWSLLTFVGVLLILGIGEHAFAQTAQQRQVADTVRAWDLLGAWSLDCSRPPANDNGYLNYEIRGPGIAMHVRNFGTSSDAHEVLEARPVEGGGLEITVRFQFESGAQMRRWVLVKRDDRIRAVSNVSVDNGSYSIRDGRFLHNGAETQWQKRCVQ